MSSGARPRGLRWASFAYFYCLGHCWGTFAACIATILYRINISNARFGVLLAAVQVAGIPAMLAMGKLLDRRGVAAGRATTLLLAACTPLPIFAPSEWTLAVSLLIFGAATASTDVAANHAAAKHEEITGVSVFNGGHAMFSVGVAIASGVVALTLVGGSSLAVPAVLACLVCGGSYVVASSVIKKLPIRTASARTQSTPLVRFKPPSQVLALAGLVGGALLVESALGQWGGVHLGSTLGASPALTGLAPGVFASAMVLTRLIIQKQQARLSDRALLLGSLVTATVGVLLLALATNPGAGLLALALTGCGLAAVAPSSYGLIGRSVAGDQRGRAVSIATSIGYIGLLSGPVVVGLLSDRVGLRSTLAGLAIITLALCAVVLALRSMNREQGTDSASRADSAATVVRGGADDI